MYLLLFGVRGDLGRAEKTGEHPESLCLFAHASFARPFLFVHIPSKGPNPGCHFLGTNGLDGVWCVCQNSEHTDPLPSCLPAVTPSAPGRVLVSRNTKSSVVVQWDRPKHEEDLLGYYVDCCVAGSNVWEPCNHKPIGYNRCCLPRAPLLTFWAPNHCLGTKYKEQNPHRKHMAVRAAETMVETCQRSTHTLLLFSYLHTGT